ncbi:hypothetical protein PsorP6_017136 [Peronosclerospora sorghi]|uniref:Uncharacterized protein n=1 Tax=Peronosclerospora sorghi TaxID=230839 RepID=A0ACC0WFQ7_9STRA|nr:hypothetical protein PsorP6_017136 [Peronosclerospora sorghi]
MWMQKSVHGVPSSTGNFHDRNRFSSSNSFGGSYSGTSQVHHDAGDWKSKILESGQWLGGKVIEYGGKLARGPTAESLSDQYGPHMPRNDGRANWMADIRSSSSSSYAPESQSRSYSGGYQNDFVTERPTAYSDYSTTYARHGSGSMGYEDKSGRQEPSADPDKQDRAMKKSEKKKQKKKKKMKEREQVDSTQSDSSQVDDGAEARGRKSKEKRKKQHKIKKSPSFYSEESESHDEHGTSATSDYSCSFDPSKLPPPRDKIQDKMTTNKTRKNKTSTKDPAGKKPRRRRNSVPSADDELDNEKKKTPKAKCRSKKAATSSCASVDLLGVDFETETVVPSRSGHEMLPSIFDATPGQDPLQDLAGLNFFTPVQVRAPSQSVVTDSNVHAATSPQAEPQSTAFPTNLLPENNIVDLSALASEKKKTLSANPNEKRTLNDLQKARGVNPPTPVMPLPVHAHHQQTMSGGVMQLNMNQLQLTDGSMGRPQYVHSNMSTQLQMQTPMALPQPSMPLMVQPQMMNMQMIPMQQFTQGGAAIMPQATETTSSKSSDLLHMVSLT